MPPFTFPQSRRLKTPAEFDRCYGRKRSAADGVLIVYACESGLPHPRLGCSVGKKVGGAVVRNRYKRLFREAFRLARQELPAGVDFVVIPRPSKAGPPPQAAVTASLLKLARQAAGKLGARPGQTPPPNPLPRGERGDRNRLPSAVPGPPPAPGSGTLFGPPPPAGEGPGEGSP